MSEFLNLEFRFPYGTDISAVERAILGCALRPEILCRDLLPDSGSGATNYGLNLIVRASSSAKQVMDWAKAFEAQFPGLKVQ